CLIFKNLMMKNVVLFFLLLFCFTKLFAQENYFAKTITDYDAVLNSNKNEIYSLNKEEFDSLVKADKNHQFHLVYSFGTWCKRCVAFLPKLLDWPENNALVRLYILSRGKDGEKELLRLKDFLPEKHNFNANAFMVSEEYGKRRWKKYDAF